MPSDVKVLRHHPCTGSGMLPALSASLGLYRQGANPKASLRVLQTSQGFLLYAGWATPLSAPGDAPQLLLPPGCCHRGRRGLPMGRCRLCGFLSQLKSDFGFGPSPRWDVSSPEPLPGAAAQPPDPPRAPQHPPETRSPRHQSRGVPAGGRWVKAPCGSCCPGAKRVKAFPTRFWQAGARVMPNPRASGGHPVSEQRPPRAALPAAAAVCRICWQIQPLSSPSQKVPPLTVTVVRAKNLGFFFPFESVARCYGSTEKLEKCGYVLRNNKANANNPEHVCVYIYFFFFFLILLFES